MVVDPYNIGIQEKRKEITKTFMIVSNRKKPFVFHGFSALMVKFDFQPEKRTHSLLIKYVQQLVQILNILINTITYYVVWRLKGLLFK